MDGNIIHSTLFGNFMLPDYIELSQYTGTETCESGDIFAIKNFSVDSSFWGTLESGTDSYFCPKKSKIHLSFFSDSL